MVVRLTSVLGIKSKDKTMLKYIKSEFNRLTLDKILIITGIVVLILVIVFWFWWGSKQIRIGGNGANMTETNFPRSSISGIFCEHYNRRPIAVMVSSDPETRPLSGISRADIVFEMPVTPGGVTRMMAVYQCSNPKEIGSVRSARKDFIPLAAGLDAIYAHWGGERDALKQLDGHIIDNVDAMKYEGVYFYRKAGIKQPHNGFTDLANLLEASEKINYRRDDRFVGYPHKDGKPLSNILNLVDTLSIDYPLPFNIKWVYDKETNTYRRWRGDKPEIDKNDSSQVKASVIVILRTSSEYISKDYININVAGKSEAEIYQNGLKILGRWEKDPARLDGKLFFYDSEGKEIEFTPGNIWIEIIIP